MEFSDLRLVLVPEQPEVAGRNVVTAGEPLGVVVAGCVLVLEWPTFHLAPPILSQALH